MSYATINREQDIYDLGLICPRGASKILGVNAGTVYEWSKKFTFILHRYYCHVTYLKHPRHITFFSKGEVYRLKLILKGRKQITDPNQLISIRWLLD